MLLSVKWHKELISRIECIDQLRENYEDAQAEFEEVLQRNPLCHTKGPGDIIYQGNTGDDDTPLPVKHSEKDAALERQVREYRSNIRQHDAGWAILTPKEQEILNKRFKEHLSVAKVASEVGYSESHTKRIISDALSKMESQMLKL